MNTELLNRLRRIDPAARIGRPLNPAESSALAEFERSGVRFAAAGAKLEVAYYRALGKLLECVVPLAGPKPVLIEGGVYRGSWLESTGTINAELLCRFMPETAQATFEQYADFLNEDGQLPYKITASGPAYRQIQMVTPLARSVWNHYLLNGRNRAFLGKMYGAMEQFDGWLSRYRDTRKTGCVEAFCTFDTGHDLSPRFWHVPDTAHLSDARGFDPDSPVLPFLAPDLTANVVCQRRYLAPAARELGKEAEPWIAKADSGLDSLMKYCWDGADEFFYDRDRTDRFVRVKSDVLLRVYACEIGDGSMFASALSRYLLNTKRFFAKFPFTSVSMDDPRFDPHSEYNTWGGTTNFLTLIRAPHAFERHGRFVELTWVLHPILNAMSRMTRFSQCLNPWTGEEGFTETYSPSMLCLLDFTERLCGILPRPDGELWFTGLVPYPLVGGEEIAGETAYRRVVDGQEFELLNSRDGCVAMIDGKELLGFPYGVRILTDRAGALRGLVGMSVRPIEGTISCGGREYPFSVEGNERLAFENGGFVSVASPGVTPPRYD